MRLIQFLSGLNESYEKARRQILLNGTTLSLNQAYAMIIEYEIQHSSYMASAVEKPSSMVMSVNRNQGTRKEHYKGKKCDYCHFLGHTKDNCYKLIRYPSDWKQRKKPAMEMGMET